MSVLVTGGTGFVGRNLVQHLADCWVASRNAHAAEQKLGGAISGAVSWDAVDNVFDQKESTFKAVVHLAGESIATGRWNEAKKKRIRDSRIDGTRQLVNAIADAKKRPDVLISTSGVGVYGSCGDSFLSEAATNGSGFLADVCTEWEAEASRVTEMGVRLVILRFGVVLGRDSGALEKMEPMFKKRLGGRLGSGQQFMPWIHIADIVRLIQWAINTPATSGTYNATAPNPVRNVDFTNALAKTIGRKAMFAVPKFALKLALGEFADTLLGSQRAIPSKALNEGFRFKFNTIEEALSNLLTDNSQVTKT